MVVSGTRTLIISTAHNSPLNVTRYILGTITHIHKIVACELLRVNIMAYNAVHAVLFEMSGSILYPSVGNTLFSWPLNQLHMWPKPKILTRIPPVVQITYHQRTGSLDPVIRPAEKYPHFVETTKMTIDLDQ